MARTIVTAQGFRTPACPRAGRRYPPPLLFVLLFVSVTASYALAYINSHILPSHLRGGVDWYPRENQFSGELLVSRGSIYQLFWSWMRFCPGVPDPPVSPGRAQVPSPTICSLEPGLPAWLSTRLRLVFKAKCVLPGRLSCVPCHVSSFVSSAKTFLPKRS